MAIQIGDGLPSTLTAERIKAVLALAKSHERILKEELDAKASTAWIVTDPDHGFYERLCALIATVEGRKAYKEARSEFENSKAKRLGRADLLRRLMEDCLKERSSGSTGVGHGYDFERESIQGLAEANDWARLAEAVWAESLIFGDSDNLLDALTTYPEIVPHLEEVQAGLIQQENDEIRAVPEAEGEANELVDRIRRVAENLHADRLNERELPGLSSDVWRLTEIAKVRTRRDRKLSSLMAQIKSWEERHAEGIRTAEAVANALAALKSQAERGAAKQNTVTAVLDLAERLLCVEARCRETQEKLNQASMDADFATARSLLNALESLNAERDDTRLAIDVLVAESRSELLPLQTPHVENKAAPPEPNTGKPETDPAKPGIRAAGPTPGTVDLTEGRCQKKTSWVAEPRDLRISGGK